MFLLKASDYAIRLITPRLTLFDQTVLWAAASQRHRLVVELLFSTDGVDANHKDSGGRTPLWLAAGNEHEAVLRVLLATNIVEPDSADNGGQPPLSSRRIF